MYTISKAYVRKLTGGTKVFQLDAGILQELALSPFLFTVIIDVLTEGAQDTSYRRLYTGMDN